MISPCPSPLRPTSQLQQHLCSSTHPFAADDTTDPAETIGASRLDAEEGDRVSPLHHVWGA